MIWLLRSRPRMALVTLVLAGLSVWSMAHFYQPGSTPPACTRERTRARSGSDRLRAGHGLAAAAGRSCPAPSSRALDAVGLVGLAGIIALVWGTSTLVPLSYGFLLLSLATAAVVAAVVNPGSLLGVVLGWPRCAGSASAPYGIYLWHWPIVVLLLRTRAASIPRGRRSRWRSPSWWPPCPGASSRNLFGRAHSGGCGAPHATAARSDWRPPPCVGAVQRGRRGAPGVRARAERHASGSLGRRQREHDRPGTANPRAHVRPRGEDCRRVRTSAAARTSCRSVVYIGDSTSAGEITAEYIPSRAQLRAQLARVGVKKIFLEIEGARSIVETFMNYPKPRPSPSSISPAASRLLDSRARNAGRRQRVRRRNRLQPGSAG